MFSIRMWRLNSYDILLVNSGAVETVDSMGKKRLEDREVQTYHNRVIKVIFPLGIPI